jgi:hypothetical protein
MFPIEILAHDSGHTLVRAEYGYPEGTPNISSFNAHPNDLIVNLIELPDNR